MLVGSQPATFTSHPHEVWKNTFCVMGQLTPWHIKVKGSWLHTQRRFVEYLMSLFWNVLNPKNDLQMIKSFSKMDSLCNSFRSRGPNKRHDWVYIWMKISTACILTVNFSLQLKCEQSQADSYPIVNHKRQGKRAEKQQHSTTNAHKPCWRTCPCV